MRKLIIYAASIFGLLTPCFPSAQSTDPTLAALIAVANSREKTAQQRINEISATSTALFAAQKEESEAIYNLQKEYTDYLESIHNALAYGAQAYGLVIETRRLSEAIVELKNTISNNPSNMMAAAISNRGSRLYADMGSTVLGILNDLAMVAFDSNSMQSEKDRIMLVLGLRPQIHECVRRTRRLILAIKYTTFNDVLREIGFNMEDRINKQSVARRCHRRWKDSYKRASISGS